MIRKAVFPVAGLGTRFLPATKAFPKEMLPVVDKPLIQYAVEEAADAGITEMIFVTGMSKRAIEDHFDRVPELERALREKSKRDLYDLVCNIPPKGVSCIFIRQAEPLGLGHAVRCAKPVIGQEDFAVILADDLMVPADGGQGVLAQMVNNFSNNFSGMLAVEQIEGAEIENYGVIGGASVSKKFTRIEQIYEKPKASVAPSNLAVVGRYIFSDEIFKAIDKIAPGKGGEIQLTDAIALLIKEKKEFHGFTFDGRRFDCGSKGGYLQATVELGMRHDKEGENFCKWLKKQVF
ncbi:UTP--glucose-1-phosphate uridylyltransferase GalU [Betaproteobacteria bacterium]|nr:UTP--glucose-1-phosphate uridylyltransferase GalU [Betaproteobacteria bacterium]